MRIMYKDLDSTLTDTDRLFVLHCSLASLVLCKMGIQAQLAHEQLWV